MKLLEEDHRKNKPTYPLHGPWNDMNAPNIRAITWSDNNSEQDRNTIVNRPVVGKLRQYTPVPSQCERLT